MLSYRQIKEEKNLPQQIWEIEQTYPEWFRQQSAVWTPDIESFMKFWDNCSEIWGLFENDKLKVCLYIEGRRDVNVHVSALDKIDNVKIVRFFKSLLIHKRSEGVRTVTGWIAKNNRFLLKVGIEAGFLPTGLVMSFGSCKNKVIDWIQVKN